MGSLVAAQEVRRSTVGSELIVDAHLDIAYNALAECRPFDGAPAAGYLLSRESLVEAGVGLVFPTIFAHPRRKTFSVVTPAWSYRTAGEAHLIGLAQLNYYRSVGLEVLGTAAAVRSYRESWKPGRLAGVLLMESADPIESPGQLPAWFEQGLRVIGPAWARTRYSGGTGAPGGLTTPGRELLGRMEELGMVLDLAHMADRAWQESLELYRGPVVATHGGSRALAPGQRQFSDEMVKAVGERGGIVGVSFFAGHLRPASAATLADVAKHIRHFATVAGGPERVGLGTDLDGGFNATEAPLRKLREIGRLAPLLQRHFSRSQVDGIMGDNWLDLLERVLP